MQRGSWRTESMTSAQRGYGYKWQQVHLTFVCEHPLCVMCENEVRLEMGTVVAHKIPHRGYQKLLWRWRNWQLLCSTHHSRNKQWEEVMRAYELMIWRI